MLVEAVRRELGSCASSLSRLEIADRAVRKRGAFIRTARPSTRRPRHIKRAPDDHESQTTARAWSDSAAFTHAPHRAVTTRLFGTRSFGVGNGTVAAHPHKVLTAELTGRAERLPCVA